MRGGVGDGGADAGIGAAAADVAGHGGVDVGVGRLLAVGQRLEEGGRAHDLAALAVAALRHVVLDPRGLHGRADAVGAIGDGFDGGDLLAVGGRDRRDAGADRPAPSRCTVQAPHSAAPQPNLVPVMPSVSRSAQRIGVAGSASTVCSRPFTTSCMSLLLAMWRWAEHVDQLNGCSGGCRAAMGGCFHRAANLPRLAARN